MAECGVEGMDVRMDPADPWERRERPFISFLIDLKQNCSADLRAKVCPVVFPRRFRSAMFVLLDIVWPARHPCAGVGHGRHCHFQMSAQLHFLQDSETVARLFPTCRV